MSTYDQWRICWLPDCDPAATASSPEKLREWAQKTDFVVDHFDLNGDPRSTLHCTGIFDYNHETLVLHLIDVVRKMWFSPYDKKRPLIRAGQRYQLLNKVDKSYTKLCPNPKLSYFPPSGNAEKFFVLQQYEEGADGRVFLAAHQDAGEFLRLCALKFPKADGGGIKKEADRWKNIHDIPATYARVATFRQEALCMPFAFHASLKPQKKKKEEEKEEDADNLQPVGFTICAETPIVFRGPDRWSLIMRQPHEEDIVHEDKEIVAAWLKLAGEKAFNDTPKEFWHLVLAQMAISKFLAKGQTHKDVEWRHLALLPVPYHHKQPYPTGPNAGPKMNLRWELKPILVDLTRVGELCKQDPKKVLAAELRSLAGKSNPDNHEVREVCDYLVKHAQF